MGQYYYVINRTKRQYIHPHKFDDGLKLLEFGCSGGGTMTALALLLADGNGRGGGDARSKSAIIGSWAGDSIVIAGDYADPGRFVDDDDAKTMMESRGADRKPNLYQVAGELFEDISDKILAAAREDGTALRSER